MRVKGFTLICSLLVLTFSIFLLACSRDTPYSGPDLALSLSKDTLRFDTVFTTLGSATRSVKVYNKLSTDILIPEIKLSAVNQMFRMNVNGVSGFSVKDVFIPGEDSIYLFVEVTIDPDAPLSVSPFIIEDKIQIETGGEILEIHLEAWGQNANYLPNRRANGTVSLLSCDLGEFVFDDPKPYVIYGVLAIDSCTLVIPAGTSVYVHGGIAKNGEAIYNDGLLLFLSQGKLRSEGTSNNPVSFQGDRLEQEFSDVEGQWAGLRFLAGSQDNIIRHTTIKNAIIGARIDSTASLTIESSIIFNTSSSGIIGYSGTIKMTNCLVYNNGGYSLQLVNGGNYDITYSTLANYYNQNEALIATNYICTDPLCSETIIFSPLNLTLRNNIIDGNSDIEFTIDDLFDGDQPALFDIQIGHNTIKHDEPDSNPSLANCANCQFHRLTDPLYQDLNGENFRLDSVSVASEKAAPLLDVLLDIENTTRDLVNPDLGCFESP